MLTLTFDGPTLGELTYSGNSSNGNIINELDFVNLILQTSKYYPNEGLRFTIGNTSFLFEEPIEKENFYYYPLKFEQLKALLPGVDSHISKLPQMTVIGNRKFYRLFLNEIGYSNFTLVYDEEIFSLGKVEIASSKITQENFLLITQYLLLNNYFDSNFFYKVTVEGDLGSINNSLIEALRRLSQMLGKILLLLNQFKKDPIYLLSTATKVVPYDENKVLDSGSVDWIIDNFENVIPGHKQTSLKLNDRKDYLLQDILIELPEMSFDSYENRIIHGFLINLHRQIIETESLIQRRPSPKTRITSFKEYLIQCFNSIVSKFFEEIKSKTFLIKSFFDREMKVRYPLLEYPSKYDGFFSKYHYKEFFKLISYSKKIFSIATGSSNFALEIESFDKLFEVYCFHLLKDILSSKFGSSFLKIQSFSSANNKDAGLYRLTDTLSGMTVELFYEGIPDDWTQYAHGGSLKPDFVIAFQKKSKRSFILLDAKFKNYSNISRVGDFESLTLKYLHKIGPSEPTKSFIAALISISLGPVNKRNHFYTYLYDVKSPKAIYPHIANIEIDPKSFKIEENLITELIDVTIKAANNP